MSIGVCRRIPQALQPLSAQPTLISSLPNPLSLGFPPLMNGLSPLILPLLQLESGFHSWVLTSHMLSMTESYRLYLQNITLIPPFPQTLIPIT